ncbi:contractile injection system tape measure protein [Flavivirga aquimarina]|uniref:Contractile injection system tape measure protein n=1 Tax=Flavivirga aquimarina TaxID=2027862 RepID=A0ABT8W762_9FLAO|nr:contractile injection system tape measure protein [Flavivirga aquimarina]MDO5968968.1 contractile injection system tape measure protein [Flavivirga aquimarina]
MKEVQTHIIKSQRYELILDNASEAYAYQSKISRLQEYGINRILQKVMDKYNSSEYLDQFDEVFLDIGTISVAGFEIGLEQRIEEALTDFFRNNSYENGTLKIGKRKQLYHKHIEQFEFFLKNGYVKWNASMSSKPIEIFKTLLQNNKKELVDLLKNLGQKETVRKRLITQLEDPFLEQIVVAAAGEEAVYINEYRRYIVKHQHDYKIIEVDSGSYRNAIWEITLAYIFTEVRSYSNQKSFLQYLIRKIAQKYRLTYKSLLHAIVLGIKSRQNKEGVIIDFEKLLVTLEKEEDEKSKNIFNDDLKKNGTVEFTKLLDYYLKYNSLPANNTLMSYNVLCEAIRINSTQNSKTFYTFFDQHIKNRTNIEQWVKRFPDHILKDIITKSPNKIFITCTLFFKQISDVANRLQVRSSTLEMAQKSLGKIALYAYSTIANSSINDITAFLYEITKHVVIDKEFIRILKRFESKKSVAQYTAIRSFINEVELIQTNENLKTTALEIESPLSELSKKIYSNYNKNNVFALIDFQKQLQHINCKKGVLQLALLLLKICSSTQQYSKHEITDWVIERHKELLQSKEQNNKVIIQLLQIIEMLSIDKKVCEGIKEAIKTTGKSKNEPVKLQEKTVLNEVSNAIIYTFIGEVYEQFYKRTTQNLKESIEALVVKFCKKHNISKTVLLSRLQEQISNRIDYKILKRILDDKLFYKSTDNDEISERYKSDVVQYFCVHGKLPWWGKSKSLKELQEYFRQTVTSFPDSFKVWFVNAKNQQAIIQLLDDASYEMIIKHVNPSVNGSVIRIKALIDDLLDKKISGIRSVPSDYKNKIKHLILNYTYRNPVLNIAALTNYLIENIVSAFAMNVSDIKVLLQEKLYDEKTNTGLIKDVKMWLDEEVKPMSKTSKLLTQVEQLIDDKKDWKHVVDTASKKDVLPMLKKICVKAPEALLFNLKYASFRKRLIKKLNNTSHIEFIQYFMVKSELLRFLDVITLLEKCRLQLSGSEYQSLWYHFIDLTLLKIAIDSPVQWSAKDWSMILYKSIELLPDKITSIEFYPETKKVSEDITNVIYEVEELIENKKEEAVENIEEMEATEEEVIGDSIYISNSGIVILGPYIAMLFERLGLLENGVFKDDYSIQKAIYILQYAATGKDEVEEQNLILNKIICGMPIHDTVEQHIPITPNEKEVVESLLKAVITSWSILGNTSIEGLRETFLCREGSISIEEDSYILRVEEKTFDMLLDQIPWGIGKLKLSWMQKLIDVIWRN